MDAVDRKILAELQNDGRLTITDLAARVGLSVSPCHRRLRELERAGVIRGYRAIVDPKAVGLTFEALLFVTNGNSNDVSVIDVPNLKVVKSIPVGTAPWGVTVSQQ